MKNPIGRPFAELPLTGYLRLRDIIKPHGPIPVSRSTWYQGIRDGRFPRPVMLGPRLPAWRVADIRHMIENGVGPND
ncbi:AlpA family phage regulatory protein [Rhabdaerophilum sp. SD176]|uniref:helix-turn-helix transcriptional regulator n=1 Tax=Rhabdaerophilum sp. SD176 TaxID=2983548 RepID=UPI0024DFFAB4|nr:AlpA family phage regulatory protein [Rhabdaerophilum sp. SD176]